MDAQGRDYLKRLKSGALRMGQLIDDLLRLFELTRGSLRQVEVDLRAMCEQILNDLLKSEDDTILFGRKLRASGIEPHTHRVDTAEGPAKARKRGIGTSSWPTIVFPPSAAWKPFKSSRRRGWIFPFPLSLFRRSSVKMWPFPP